MSARIQAEAHNRWARRPSLAPERVFPTIEELERGINVPIRDLAQLEPDPESMTNLKGIDEPRDFERPDEIETALERFTPQFFLRNTHRMEKFADVHWLDSYTFIEVDGRDDPWVDIEVARSCCGDFAKVRLANLELTSKVMASLVADRRHLVVETAWADTFGRAEERTPGGPGGDESQT